METNNKYSGPIAWMARNRVAANLLMFVIFVGGFVGIFQTKTEIFPEFDLGLISIAVPYPGASPTEVEQGILLAIEEEVRGIDGIKRVTSVAHESSGTISAELLLDANSDRVLADVKSAVDRITSLPEEAEKPIVSLVTPRRPVISLVIAGDRDIKELHNIAEGARAELLAEGKITQVDISGVNPLEISVEVSRETLSAYGLSLNDIAARIRASSVELPGGAIKTPGGELLVRVADRKKAGHEFADIILFSGINGAKVNLLDIADIYDGYEDTDRDAYYNGKRAVRLTAFRVGSETPIDVANAVKDYVERLKAKIPADIEVVTWEDSSKILAERMDLLQRNAKIGLLLVFVLLTLLLNYKLAFWVSLGIPISFFGAFLLMPALDVSINMISLFAFIVTLGMVVDDAIVVGENIYTKIEGGASRLSAAIDGAREMAMPVTFSILTTVAAFAPLLLVPGVMGKVFRIIPLVVIAVLMTSLIEAFFILPAHLSHAGKTRSFDNKIEGFQSKIGEALKRFTFGPYTRLLKLTIHNRKITLSIAAALLIVSVGLIAGRILQFRFFPEIEGDVIKVAARLPYGTPVERTLEVQKELEAAALRVVEKNGGKKILKGIFSQVGEGMSAGRMHGSAALASGSHLCRVEVNLVSSEDRDVGAEQFSQLWREETPPLPGLESLLYKASTGPSAGAAIDVQISHANLDLLEPAAAEAAEYLRAYNELVNVENSFAEGKTQLDFHLTSQAKTIGLTSTEVGRQLRASFYGAEALREQRGRNEIRVMVRLPEDQRRSLYDLEELLIKTPTGKWTPLDYIADYDRGRSPTEINREDGRRIINVTADLARGIKSSQPIVQSINEEFIPKMQKKYPGLKIELAGEQREQKESMKSLGQNFLVTLFVMFALLAIPLRSYIQPLVILSVIPFGFVGAVIGHLLMGYSLSILSMFGLVALAGVVVNDSLVLIDKVNQDRASGLGVEEAIISAAQTRLRPIILTSLTTFLGLAPMIFETSLQARFLIPMALSLGFGVLFATLIVLILVPSVYIVAENFRVKFSRTESEEIV